jgi:ribokinase
LPKERKTEVSTPKICVVGSSNIDLIAKVSRLPKMGETLEGRYFHISCGGKGANQAVMAGKLGARVSMITKVGNDHLGHIAKDNFKDMGIDSSYIFTTDETSSGVAPILVDDQGRNLLVYIPGANMLFSPEEVDRAAKQIASADILICQLEIPLESSERALRIARDNGVRTVFNPAPARSLDRGILDLCDIIIPNETETEIITGLPVGTLDQISVAGQRLRDMGCETVIITLGERGSMLFTAERTLHVPAVKTKVIDTTGAGDAFIGSFAFFWGAGNPLDEAVRRANSIAAISVGKVGTQVSFPWAREIADLLA